VISPNVSCTDSYIIIVNFITVAHSYTFVLNILYKNVIVKKWSLVDSKFEIPPVAHSLETTTAPHRHLTLPKPREQHEPSVLWLHLCTQTPCTTSPLSCGCISVPAPANPSNRQPSNPPKRRQRSRWTTSSTQTGRYPPPRRKATQMQIMSRSPCQRRRRLGWSLRMRRRT